MKIYKKTIRLIITSVIAIVLIFLTTFWKSSSLPSFIGDGDYLNSQMTVGVNSHSEVVNNTIKDDALMVKLSYEEDKIKKLDPIEECKNRLSSLEPQEGTNIDSSPTLDIPLPTNIKPISEVIKKGKEIPIRFAYNDLNWKRPAYKDYWHTVEYGGRWSYVPERVNYALHRIFVYPPTASISYDEEHNLGIGEESEKFNFDISNIHQFMLAIMQSKIKKIVTLDNQVVVIVEPNRTGLQVLTILEEEITPLNKDESVIFQMVTPDGYEIDYSLIYK